MAELRPRLQLVLPSPFVPRSLSTRCGHSRCQRRNLVVQDAVVGIDLGTSNSAVAAVIDGEARVLKDISTGSNCVPSVVAVTEYDQTLVGERAQQASAGTANTFYSFKRLIGRKLGEVATDDLSLLYALGEGDRGEAMAYCPHLDDMISPEELSSWLLQHLLRQAEQQLQESVDGAVITVPAHFDERQKGATLRAATMAGLPESRVQLLQEPVAAALAYGIGGGTDGETVLVFDVGGGTYDVSILQAFEGILEVLGTAGDSQLGGNDFDALLADWLQHHTGSADRQWALQAAEQAKIQLSSAGSAAIPLPQGTSSRSGLSGSNSTSLETDSSSSSTGVGSTSSSSSSSSSWRSDKGSITLSQQTFEAVTAPLFQRLAAPLEQLGQQLFVEWAEPPAQAVPGRQQQDTAHSNGSSGSGGGGVGGRSGVGDGSSARQQQGKRREAQQAQQGKWAAPPRRISRVVLVGQSTRLPALRRFVERVTGVRPDMGVDPAEAVALGAAVQAGILLGQLGSVELMDGSYSVDLHGRATGFGSQGGGGSAGGGAKDGAGGSAAGSFGSPGGGGSAGTGTKDGGSAGAGTEDGGSAGAEGWREPGVNQGVNAGGGWQP